MKFPQLALRIFRPFISTAEISDSDLLAILTRSFATFSHADVTPLHQLSPDTFILELFHGPTFAFKDVALQVVGNLFEFFLEKRNRGIDGESSRHFITVVGATSGDTG